MIRRDKIIKHCELLLKAFKSGGLGQTVMPEDTSPGFSDNEREERLSYFSLPMALNYQRNSYKLWESALKTYDDRETKIVFDVKSASGLTEEELKHHLLKYRLALQPNKHIETWQRIAQTVADNWGSFSGLIESSDFDFLKLKDIVQKNYKKGFPYLSGAKIFNYWSFILNSYCKGYLKNSQFIDIAPDTHIIKCSVLLKVLTEIEAETLSRESISERWRTILDGSNINPIDMHSPLWFWSKNGFVFKLPENQKLNS